MREIENISRKQTIDYILDGKELDFEALCRYCDQERLSNSSQRRVGFGN